MNKNAYLFIKAVAAWYDYSSLEFLKFEISHFHEPYKILFQLIPQAVIHHLPEDFFKLSRNQNINLSIHNHEEKHSYI